MRTLFASGHVVDVILAVMVAEAVFLVARGRPVADIATALLPGTLILLALRAALTHAGWPWIALALAGSFPAHLLDLYRRRP